MPLPVTFVVAAALALMLPIIEIRVAVSLPGIHRETPVTVLTTRGPADRGVHRHVQGTAEMVRGRCLLVLVAAILGRHHFHHPAQPDRRLQRERGGHGAAAGADRRRPLGLVAAALGRGVALLAAPLRLGLLPLAALAVVVLQLPSRPTLRSAVVAPHPVTLLLGRNLPLLVPILLTMGAASPRIGFFSDVAFRLPLSPRRLISTAAAPLNLLACAIRPPTIIASASLVTAILVSTIFALVPGFVVPTITVAFTVAVTAAGIPATVVVRPLVEALLLHLPAEVLELLLGRLLVELLRAGSARLRVPPRGGGRGHAAPAAPARARGARGSGGPHSGLRSPSASMGFGPPWSAIRGT